MTRMRAAVVEGNRKTKQVFITAGNIKLFAIVCYFYDFLMQI